MMRRLGFASVAAGLALAAVAPAQFAAAGVSGAASVQHPASGQHDGSAASFHMPYTDPDQAGLLTLCNKQLQPITHGSVNTVPFVWRIVSSVPTPAGWRVKGVTASLFAYQPRPFTPAGAWSGEALTAASLFSNLAHPMVQETPIDQPLTQMTNNFPPIWDHLIELRIYLGAPDHQASVLGYGAADIQISGNTWTMVEGGHASCTSGTAISREVILGLPGANGKATQQTAAKTGAAAHASPAASTAGSSSDAAPRSATAASATASDSSSAIDPAAIGIGVLVVLLLALAGFWRGRRRRARAGL